MTRLNATYSERFICVDGFGNPVGAGGRITLYDTYWTADGVATHRGQKAERIICKDEDVQSQKAFNYRPPVDWVVKSNSGRWVLIRNERVPYVAGRKLTLRKLD